MLNIRKFLGLTYYVSELDQFLEAYRQKHNKLSSTQRRERDKYARIFDMRDKTSHTPPSRHALWDKF